jgi:hypothetical protein
MVHSIIQERNCSDRTHGLSVRLVSRWCCVVVNLREERPRKSPSKWPRRLPRKILVLAILVANHFDRIAETCPLIAPVRELPLPEKEESHPPRRGSGEERMVALAAVVVGVLDGRDLVVVVGRLGFGHCRHLPRLVAVVVVLPARQVRVPVALPRIAVGLPQRKMLEWATRLAIFLPSKNEKVHVRQPRRVVVEVAQLRQPLV